MAKTTAMRLVEFMVYKDDIHEVLKYLGTLGEFQFQSDMKTSGNNSNNHSKEIFDKLEVARSSLDIKDIDGYKESIDLPKEGEEEKALEIIKAVEDLHKREIEASENAKHMADSYKEACAFSNLKVSFSKLESLSFLTMRIGKIDPSCFESLRKKLEPRAAVVRLGDDDSRIMVACSKKARFFVDTELKNVGFVKVEIPHDFMGIPDELLEKLKNEVELANKVLEDVKTERKNYALTHEELISHLLQRFSVASQIDEVESNLEATEFVYRITGWIPAYISRDVIKHLSDITDNRCAIREFLPSEVPSVVKGEEKVPVELKHGKVVANFERMIFSYGAPMYGTVDPTPFVAIFFTVLFGIMFGDAGQGLVFLVIGILMCAKKFKLMGWEKFGPIFVCIGVSSTIMGVLTGEVFATEELLVPFSRWVTGLFGESRDVILHLMPTGSPESILNMFKFFAFTVGIGFIINSTGIIINMVNNFSLKRVGKALFGKNGLSGALFFWYVIYFALRVALFNIGPAVYDWCILGITLLVTAFSEPLERLVDGERPVIENGALTAVIGALVEIIEVLSSYISNTVSFLRVGAFALSHAVLSYIIAMMVNLVGGAGGIVISVIGNLIIIVLEGMIVAIQVVRLQYYEFFSKFFTETGREFEPFCFKYQKA